MTRVKCKDEGHEGESDWVDREDCLLVPRYAGGNYRRAGRMYPTVICVACTSRYVAKIEAGEYQGALKVNRWSKSGLTYQYAQFRRPAGLPERNPMSNEPKTAPEGTQDDSEATIAVPWDDLPEEERQAWIDAAKPGVFPTKHAQGKADYERANREEPKAPHLAYRGLVPRKPGEFHHHFDLTSEAGLAKCVFCGQGAGVKCAGPKADEWEARMQARGELKERIFSLAYGRSPEGHAEAADAMAEFNAETLRLFPGHFREPTPEEQEARERFRELVSAPLMTTFRQTAAADAFAIALDGYEAANSAEEVADRALNPCKERNHRRWHCHYAKGHKGEHAFTDADEGFCICDDRELEDDAQTYHRLTERQSDLLSATVNALRGAPPELVWWSHHDVAELAQAAVQTIARILAKPLEWSNVKPENKDLYLAQARKMVVEEAGNG